MRRSLGIEIGATEIRWVELEEERGHERGGGAVRASGIVALAGTGSRATGDALRTLAAAQRWRSREVVVSLPRSAVTLRWVTLPHASREETAGMVELEAVQSLPFPTEEAAWDFLSYSAPAGERVPGRQEVLMVAARRSLVQELRRQMEGAGLRLAAIAIDALATTALYRDLLPAVETAAVLVSLEGETATLSCVEEDRLLLSRSVTLERRDAAALAVELRRTLVAGMTAATGPAPAAIGAVWLTGEGADAALAAELETILGEGEAMRVALLPKSRLTGAEALEPAMDTALGLALLGLRPAAERLDLARTVRAESDRRAEGTASRLPLLVGAGAAALAVALLVLWWPWGGDRGLAATAARAQADVRRLQTRQQQLAAQVKLLSGAVSPAHSYLDVLNDVSALAGPDVWLTEYTYQRGRPVVIRGAARSNEAVARMVEGLRRSPHLASVALGSATRAEIDKKERLSVVQFTVTGLLPGDQPLEMRHSRRARPAAHPRAGTRE